MAGIVKNYLKEKKELEKKDILYGVVNGENSSIMRNYSINYGFGTIRLKVYKDTTVMVIDDLAFLLGIHDKDRIEYVNHIIEIRDNKKHEFKMFPYLTRDDTIYLAEDRFPAMDKSVIRAFINAYYGIDDNDDELNIYSFDGDEIDDSYYLQLKIVNGSRRYSLVASDNVVMSKGLDVTDLINIANRVISVTPISQINMQGFNPITDYIENTEE